MRPAFHAAWNSGGWFRSEGGGFGTRIADYGAKGIHMTVSHGEARFENETHSPKGVLTEHAATTISPRWNKLVGQRNG